MILKDKTTYLYVPFYGKKMVNVSQKQEGFVNIYYSCTLILLLLEQVRE